MKLSEEDKKSIIDYFENIDTLGQFSYQYALMKRVTELNKINEELRKRLYKLEDYEHQYKQIIDEYSSINKKIKENPGLEESFKNFLMLAQLKDIKLG